MLYSPTAPSGRWIGMPRAGPLSMPARKVDRNAPRGPAKHARQPVEFRHHPPEGRVNVAGWVGGMELAGAPEDDLRGPRQDGLPHLGDEVVACALHLGVV